MECRESGGGGDSIIENLDKFSKLSKLACVCLFNTVEVIRSLKYSSVLTLLKSLEKI